MKKLNFLFLSLFLSFAIWSCEDDDMEVVETTDYRVTIENVMSPKDFFASGVFNTPEGDAAPGPATPGKQYKFSFYAPTGSYLSFATMFGQSNDLFYAPNGEGIMLYNGSAGISGNITDQIKLWDAGTEVNEEPGAGANQAPRQSGPNMGTAESVAVREISMVNDGYTYPSVDDVINASIEYMGGNMFEVTLENVSTTSTLMTSMGNMPAPHSPGVWVVHMEPDPLFKEGEVISDDGLERIAEEGDPMELNEHLDEASGYVSPISPGVWAVTDNNINVFFTEGSPTSGNGLERLAEEGDTGPLSNSIMGNTMVKSSGVFNTPVGASGPGPIFPGQMYEFEVTLAENERLSLVTMLGNSNDFIFSFDDMGIVLSDLSGMDIDITSSVYLYDAGTEVDEYPGAGSNQAPRQAAPNTGAAENGNVIKVNGTDNGYMWPMASDVIKIIVTPISEQ